VQKTTLFSRGGCQLILGDMIESVLKMSSLQILLMYWYFLRGMV
jgi:hypothetical protein